MDGFEESSILNHNLTWVPKESYANVITIAPDGSIEWKVNGSTVGRGSLKKCVTLGVHCNGLSEMLVGKFRVEFKADEEAVERMMQQQPQKAVPQRR